MQTDHRFKVPELLAPAGNLEKLKVAISYGANAVYLGGQKFGLRQASDNFTYDELRIGVEFAHDHGAKVYVVLNSFLHDKDLEELPPFVRFLEELAVDAVIVSDLGVIKTVKEFSNLTVHLSTQASCLNAESGKLWKSMGATRLIVGREMSVKETSDIKKATGLEVEMFIHGSMCMAYSGNCVISNYTQGRDSNRGGCAHSCRFEYSFEMNDQEKKNAFFMSSKDLEGVRVLPEFIAEGIDSIKIEGRMKSNLYAGTVSKVYAEALKYYRDNGNFLSNDLENWAQELTKISHRSYTNASLLSPADDSSIFNERESSSDHEYVVAGNIIEVKKNAFMILEVKNAFNIGDTLELLPFRGKALTLFVQEMTDMKMNSVTRTKPSTLVKLPYLAGAEQWNIVRRRVTP
ncbi:MAG: peptidase U32 family protein [Bacteriovoracaceae bacterium]